MPGLGVVYELAKPHPNPSPSGEGLSFSVNPRNKTPLLHFWEKGQGDEGISPTSPPPSEQLPANAMHVFEQMKNFCTIS